MRWRISIWPSDILEKVKTEIGDIAKVEQFPKLEGRQMIMVMAPLKYAAGRLQAMLPDHVFPSRDADNRRPAAVPNCCACCG